MNNILALVSASVSTSLLTIGAVAMAPAQTKPTPDPPTEIAKVARVGVWQPGPGGTQVPLWPNDLAILKPDSGDHPEETGNGSPLVGGRAWHWASYVSRPTMSVYRPKRKTGGATILVLPGGGFSAVAIDLEGTEICDWVVRQGMTCVILKYRAPQEWTVDKKTGFGRRPEILLALQDAQRAVGLLRHGAARYGIDPHKIGVMGFSAGAYVAASLSNAERRTYPTVDAADRAPSRPDFAVLAYTGRLWDRSNAKTDLGLAPWVTISAKAPPTLLIHAMNDPTDNVRHAMAYALALNEVGVPVDLRLYAKGRHAFGMRPTTEPVTREWPGQVRQWLQDLGML